jgi:hypothetical protein
MKFARALNRNIKRKKDMHNEDQFPDLNLLPFLIR